MISWLTFEWNKASLTGSDEVSAPFVLRQADGEERDTVERVLANAVSMDTAWCDVTRAMIDYMRFWCERTFASPEPPCIVLLHGQRIIGASLLKPDPNADNHLLSGPMILHEYSNRGLGSGLLKASLGFLANQGVDTARGMTRARSTAARFVYSKFGGKSQPGVADPLRNLEG